MPQFLDHLTDDVLPAVLVSFRLAFTRVGAQATVLARHRREEVNEQRRKELAC